MILGNIFLIPTPLGENDPLEVLPVSVKKTVENLKYFIVENEKSARHFIKKLVPEKDISEIELYLIDKHSIEQNRFQFIALCEKGIDIGILSEAGLPAIADPGSEFVEFAHQKNIKIVPLVGPSSIFLAMMSSGFNGQNFAFNGYLPIEENEKRKKIKLLEKRSLEEKQAQIFIETPYRNNKLLESLLGNLNSETNICIAMNLTLENQYIKTKKVSEWKKIKPELHKQQVIFIIQS